MPCCSASSSDCWPSPRSRTSASSTLGLGASIVLASEGEDGWAAIAFAAALFQILNHAVFKSLLFLGAGAIERATGGLDLDRLGGLLSRMPWSGGAFLVGAMAIAGLPPLNGFASEWVTLQALLHLGIERPAGFGVAGALATAGLAATAALALYCFVKVAGLVLLGDPRRPEVASATEPPARNPVRARLPRRSLPGLGLALRAGGSAAGGAGTDPGLTRRPARRWTCPAPAGSRRRSRRPCCCSSRCSGGLAATGARRARPRGRAGSSRRRRRAGGRPASRSRRGSCSKRSCAPDGISPSPAAAGWSSRCRTRTRSRTSSTPPFTRPCSAVSLRIARLARRLQSGSVRTYAAYLLGLLLGALLLLCLGVLG